MRYPSMNPYNAHDVYAVYSWPDRTYREFILNWMFQSRVFMHQRVEYVVCGSCLKYVNFSKSQICFYYNLHINFRENLVEMYAQQLLLSRARSAQTHIVLFGWNMYKSMQMFSKINVNYKVLSEGLYTIIPTYVHTYLHRGSSTLYR